MSQAGSVSQHPGTFVKQNKNQLRDCMIIGPARLAETPCNRANRASTFSLFNFASEQNDPPFST